MKLLPGPWGAKTLEPPPESEFLRDGDRHDRTPDRPKSEQGVPCRRPKASPRCREARAFRRQNDRAVNGQRTGPARLALAVPGLQEYEMATDLRKYGISVEDVVRNAPPATLYQEAMLHERS